MNIEIHSIGVIRSDYKNREDLPRQSYMNESEAEVILKDEYGAGLDGLKVGDYIDVLFNFHRSSGEPIRVISRKSNKEVGVFASRSPNRPNNIGVSRVEIINLNKNIIKIKGVDMLDGTPVIDIKPSIN